MSGEFVVPEEWARQQMDELEYDQSIRTAVLRLLEVWWTMNHSDASRDLTLSTFESLARGQSLVQDSEDEVWEQAKPGGIFVRDEIRVRRDAYSDQQTGRAHNGRRGRVVAIRHGDVIVNYTDGRTPPGQGVHHSPHALERRV